MSSPNTRLELLIDIFHHRQQRAVALPTLRPSELITAILQEFTEVEFLSDNPADYQLVKAGEQTPLDDEAPLGKQVRNGQPLVLLEIEAPLPKGAQRPTVPIYLRESASGKVFKIHWLPAVIGRPDPQARDNDQVAVNLEALQTGLRVSRRHARIVEEGGHFALIPVSANPTSLQRNGINQAVTQPQKLEPGAFIHLDRSGISLKFLVRVEGLKVDGG